MRHGLFGCTVNYNRNPVIPGYMCKQQQTVLSSVQMQDVVNTYTYINQHHIYFTWHFFVDVLSLKVLRDGCEILNKFIIKIRVNIRADVSVFLIRMFGIWMGTDWEWVNEFNFKIINEWTGCRLGCLAAAVDDDCDE